MSVIKKLPKKDYTAFVDIVANAYPGFKIITEQDKKKSKKRLLTLAKDTAVNHYGLYRKGKLLGGMALYDFNMNLLSIKIKIGGIGLIGVDLLHKKEQVCKEMVYYFLEQYRKKGVNLVGLYPFRPDFYKKMGFGYGTKVSQYRVKPADLPKGKSKAHIHFLKKTDKRALKNCYYRFFTKMHGMIENRDYKWDDLFDHPEVKIIGYKKGNKILGYIVFTFKKSKGDNWLDNDILVREFIYEDRDVFLELLTFLHIQLDQFNHVIFGIHDEYLHHLLLDPRNGSDNLLMPLAHETNVQGVGIMYKVINMKGMFKSMRKHNFNNQTCNLKIFIMDSFFKKNEGSTIIQFEKGKPSIRSKHDYDVEIRLDVSDFSSLLMGVVNFKTLYKYGIAEISTPQYIDTVNKIFITEEKPMCTTLF
ncbi:MAG: GNAT family N-acetyltransferase [bacterium]